MTRLICNLLQSDLQTPFLRALDSYAIRRDPRNYYVYLLLLCAKTSAGFEPASSYRQTIMVTDRYAECTTHNGASSHASMKVLYTM